jgi:hypothetical protein
VRPDQTSNYWGVELSTDIPGPAPYCFDLNHYLGGEEKFDSVAYMVGDFTPGANPLPIHEFVRAFSTWGTGSSTAKVEWDRGADSLVVDGPTAVVQTWAGDLVHVWNVALQAGKRYLVHFARTIGTANTNLALFDNPGGAYWKPRDAATRQAAGDFLFDAPRTDWYGIVVANDNGQDGFYEVSVSLPLVGVGDEPAVATGLERVLPNPSAGASRIQYALARPGSVSFDVVNAAGRRVARIAEGARAAGHWSVDWNGAGESGARLPAGVYFVRMRVDGEPLGATTVRLL